MAIDSQRNSRALRTSATESASAGTMQEVRAEPSKAPTDGWLAPVLVNSRLLTPDQARQLLAPGTSAVWAAAVTHGWTSDESIAAAVARMYRLPLADVTTSDSRTTTLVPESLARKHKVVPLSATDRTIQIASADPRDLDLEQTLRFVTGREVAFRSPPPPP
jgi:Type II secretion system (T2SS), protein E, N-terminal domain